MPTLASYMSTQKLEYISWLQIVAYLEDIVGEKWISYLYIVRLNSRQSKCQIKSGEQLRTSNLELVTTVLIGTIRSLKRFPRLLPPSLRLHRFQSLIHSRREHNFSRNKNLVVEDILAIFPNFS